MTTSPYENLLVGVIAALAAAYLAWSVWRAAQQGHVRTRGGELTAAANPGRFKVLMVFRGILALVTAVIAADLLLGLDLQGRF